MRVDIIAIGNLEGLNKLQKLQLDNNIITKIQGLDHLEELRWLDLSFNMIEKIEGLSNLKYLEDLSLFNNKITKLEGLEELVHLNVLSVGSNELDNLEEQVLYLKSLNNNLQVLKIKNNKFKETGEKEYKKRIIAFLGGLQYLDYELIEPKVKEEARKDYSQELEATQQNEKAAEKGVDNDGERALQDLKEAHIESTKDIFQVCCAAFEDFPKISSFIHYNDVFMFFEGPIEEVVVKFQNEAKASYKNLKEIRQFCQEKMSNAERKAERESIAEIEKYRKVEKHTHRKIDQLRAQQGNERIDFDPYENELLTKVEEMQSNLMDIEVKVQQALAEARNQFVRKANDIVEEVGTVQKRLFQEEVVKFLVEFKEKLDEELNKEKEDF